MADKKKQLDAALSHALMNDMERIEYGFATYWKQIVIAAVAVVIVIAAVFGYFAVSRNAAREAAFALADAATVDELNAALDKYADVPGVAAVRFRLAKLLSADKKYDEALQELTAVKAAKPGEPLLGMAMLSMAYIQELKGSYEAAAAEFEAIGALPEVSAGVRAEACTNAGRLYLQLKELNKAAAALKRADIPDLRSTTAAAWSMDAKSLLVALESGEYGPYKPETAPVKL